MSITAHEEITLNVCGYVENGFNILRLNYNAMSVLEEITVMIKRNKWNFEKIGLSFLQGRKRWYFCKLS